MKSKRLSQKLEKKTKMADLDAAARNIHVKVKQSTQDEAKKIDQRLTRQEKEIEAKARCLTKKKYVCLFIFSDITEVVEEKEKNNPNNKRNTNKNKIFLSTFLHHLATKPVFSLSKLNI